jgi:Flp pilus assembly protein TadD
VAFHSTSNTLDPNDTVAICMIGLVLERMGDLDSALEHYGQALRLRPNDELATKLMASAGD